MNFYPKSTNMTKCMSASLQNGVYINVLNSQYNKNCNKALNCAMSEIFSMEVPIPKFNTLGCLTKDTFYKVLCHCKRRLQENNFDKQVDSLLIIGIIDTLTCMIKEWKFFEEYRSSIKHLLFVMVRSLSALESHYFNTKELDTKQMDILVTIIQKFLNRIKDHEQFDPQFKNNIEMIIKSLKIHCDENLEKLKNGNNHTLTSSQNDDVKENEKSLPNLNKTTERGVNKKILKRGVEEGTKNNISENPKKPMNAFTYMMSRSKTVLKKK